MNSLSAPVQILVVDDDPGFADMTATFLEREVDVFETETATSASEGLASLEHTSFDCIVSDYEMPRQNGIEFLETVREDYPELPFILFTGKGSEDVASDAFSAGASEYLQKETGTDQYTVLANRIVTVVANARAQRRQQRQLEAIENAQEGIAILDEDGYYRYANERYGEIYDIESAEIRGMHWEEFYPAEEMAYVNDEILATIDEVGYWHGQTTNLTANGETIELNHTISRTEDGGLVCTIRNLSEQEVLEQQLLRFRTVTETLNDPVYVCDETGHFEYVNDAFVTLVGYDRERLIGSHPSLIKSENAVEVAEENLGRILSSSGPDSVTFEVEIQPKDGNPIVCEDHMGVLPYDGPQFRGSVGVLRDISERKERERELARQNRRLDQLASVLSHDLRNPLSVARGQLALAREQEDNEHLTAVDTALDRMDELIETLLTLAREGQPVRERETINLEELADASWQNVTTGDTEFIVACDRTLLGDSSRLKELLEDLYRNAIEHGGEDVTVTVGELADGFYVEDDGPGIPDDKRHEVFEAGYSTADDGTGFGLSIVKQIARAHGWEVTVTEGADGGARFEITGVDCL